MSWSATDHTWNGVARWCGLRGVPVATLNELIARGAPECGSRRGRCRMARSATG